MKQWTIAVSRLAVLAGGCGDIGSLASVAESRWEIDIGASPYANALDAGDTGTDPFSGWNADLPPPQFAIVMGPDENDCPTIEDVTGTLNGRPVEVDDQFENDSITISTCFRLLVAYDFERDEVLDLIDDEETIEIELIDDRTTLTFEVQPLVGRPLEVFTFDDGEGPITDLQRGVSHAIGGPSFNGPVGLTAAYADRPSVQLGEVAVGAPFTPPEDMRPGDATLWGVTQRSQDLDEEGQQEEVLRCDVGSCFLRSTLEIGHTPL